VTREDGIEVAGKTSRTGRDGRLSRLCAGWRTYAAIVAGCAATQLVLSLLVAPNHTFGNLIWYYAMAGQMRASGLFAVWTPYPPLFSLLLYWHKTLLASWGAFLRGWQVLNVTLVLAIAVITHRIVARTSREQALPAAIGFVLVNSITSSAIAIGYYFDQYDYVPILLMMVSIVALESDRPLGSALSCALGAMTKAFPAAVLPVAILTLDRRRRIQYALVFVAVASIVTLPWLIAGPDTLRSFLRYYTARQPWETIWTFPSIRFPALHHRLWYFLVPFHRSHIRDTSAPWLTELTVVAMAAYLAWWRRKPARDVPTAVLALLLILLIFSKGVSSYYPFWLFPLIFVVYRPVQACMICLAFLLVGNIEFVPPGLRPTEYWIAIWGRQALLVGLFAHVVSKQWSQLADTAHLTAGLALTAPATGTPCDYQE